MALSGSEYTQQDFHYMARAIMLAKNGKYTTTPNPNVGCVLVSNTEGKEEGKIIGEGFHKKSGENHAEINALNQAKQNHPALIKGSTAYVTLEPCSHFGRTPPCAQALIEAQISTVIIAMEDPNPKVSGNGLAMLDAAGIKTKCGLLENEAIILNLGFIKNMQTSTPYVCCKLAASLDGKTAMKNGESKWITSPQARQDVQRLRAQSCAIISGADSIIIDDAKMTVRWSELGELKNTYNEADIRQPVRVIIDSQNRLSPNLALFTEQSSIIIIHAPILKKKLSENKVSEKGIYETGITEKLATSTLEKTHEWPHFVEHVTLPVVSDKNNKQKIDLSTLLTFLAKRGFNDVLVESGARLAGAFIEQGLVDELVLYQAPKLLGGEGKNLIEMPNIHSLSSAKLLNISDVRMVGADIKVTAKLTTLN